jgi:hypothetical protein
LRCRERSSIRFVSRSAATSYERHNSTVFNTQIGPCRTLSRAAITRAMSSLLRYGACKPGHRNKIQKKRNVRLMARREIRAGRLLVEFVNQGDRLGHLVSLASDAAAACLLASVEGGEPSWPASPTCQELHVEERGGGLCVALLVGRAGSSHWSMSIEADSAAERLTFDIACRLKAPPQWLGSTYQTTEPARLVEGDVLFSTGLVMKTLGAPTGDRAQAEIIGDIVRITSAGWSEGELDASTSARTLRWQYAIELPR